MLKGLAGITLMKFKEDWSQPNEYGFEYSRKVIEFIGGITKVYSFTNRTPKKFKISVQSKNKNDEFSILEKWFYVLGRLKKFWIIENTNSIEILNNQASTSLVIEIRYNRLSLYGNERLAIEMLNGDIITGEIESITHDQANDVSSITLKEEIGYNIDHTKIKKAGFLILGRFFSDDLDFEFLNRDFALLKIEFIELIGEYP